MVINSKPRLPPMCLEEKRHSHLICLKHVGLLEDKTHVCSQWITESQKLNHFCITFDQQVLVAANIIIRLRS